jgi:hypothetical protein
MSDTLESPPKRRRWSTVPTALLGAGAGAALTATAFLGVGMASAATAEPDSGTDSSETETPAPGTTEDGTAEPGTTPDRPARGEHGRGGGDCEKQSSTEETETPEEDSGTAS